MALKPGKRAARRIMDILDDDLDSLSVEGQEELFSLAGRILAEAFNIYEELAKFTVVGQLYYEDGRYYDPDDTAADKVALGNYQTAKQAESAAHSLTLQGGTEFRSWVLPVHHASPAAWASARREAMREKLRREESPWESEAQTTS